MSPGASADGAVEVRRARVADVDALPRLGAEHAAFERAALDDGPEALASRRVRLADALDEPVPRLRAWLALADREPVGCASAALECSTWEAREYLHLDCLFVRDGLRGAGVGARLLGTVMRYAGDAGLAQVQWQTPIRNDGARCFYRRVGAAESIKARFTLDAARRCRPP